MLPMFDLLSMTYVFFPSPCGLCSRSLCTSLCSLFLLFSTHSNKKSDNLGTLPVFDFCHQTPCENLFCFFLILLSCFPEYDLKGETSFSFDETLYHRHILCMCVCNLISRNGLNQYCSIQTISHGSLQPGLPCKVLLGGELIWKCDVFLNGKVKNLYGTIMNLFEKVKNLYRKLKNLFGTITNLSGNMK